MQDNAASDDESKRDLIGLLLRARKAEMEQQYSDGETSYQISEKDMKEHIVCCFLFLNNTVIDIAT
jgi:hypothetical protein